MPQLTAENTQHIVKINLHPEYPDDLPTPQRVAELCKKCPTLIEEIGRRAYQADNASTISGITPESPVNAEINCTVPHHPPTLMRSVLTIEKKHGHWSDFSRGIRVDSCAVRRRSFPETPDNVQQPTENPFGREYVSWSQTKREPITKLRG